MKLNFKHAFMILAMAFLFASPVIAAANAGEVVVAQDFGDDFFFTLIQNGAEIAYASIDEQGVPAVIYGQLGIPSEGLGLEQSGPGEMYEGCVATALLATHGEFLDYLFDAIGGPLLNISGDGGGGMSATQFGGDGGFDFNSIFQMVGTEFNLLFDIFIDLTDAEAQSNMNQIQTYLQTQFSFTFSELLNLRIDESFFPPEMEVTLPFDGINIFVYQITNPFEDAINSVLSVMDNTGFLQSIDTDKFSEMRASGAGLLAIPDMGNLQQLFEGFGGEEPAPMSASSFLISQMPDMDGPVAIAGAGYIGEQLLSTTSDELKVFETLFGKMPLTNINGISGGQSLVAVQFPPDVNITSYSPEDEALNRTFYDSESGMVFWNASAYSNQNEYTISFEEGSFPPLITIHRRFTPNTLTAGGMVTVEVGVHNEGVEPIYNIDLTDTTLSTLYPSLTITGTQSTSAAVLDAGDWLNISYTVTFVNEGGYLFAPAVVSYEYENNTYTKTSHIDGYTVSPDLVGLLSQMISEGMPYTGIMIGVVGLGAIVNIGLMARGRGGGGSYQV